MSAGTPAPTPGELRGLIRGWRRGHVTTPWGELLYQAYVALLTVLIYGSGLVTAVINAGQAVEGCATVTCSGTRAAGPVLLVLVWLALGAAVLRLLGPLMVSPAASALVLSTPVDRGRWLGRQYVTASALSAFAAAVLALLAAVTAGWPLLTGTALALAAALLAPVTYAAGSIAQARPRSVWRAVAPAAALLALAAVGAVAAGVTADMAPPEDAWWWLVPAALAPAAAGSVVLARRRLGELRRRDLTRGHGLANGLSGALAGMDTALAYDVVLQHTSARRALVRARRLRGPRGPLALVTADLVRLRRAPVRVLAPAATVVPAYALAEAGAGALTVPAMVVLGFWAAIPLGAGVRVLSRSSSLARLLGASSWQLRLGALVVPAVVLVAFGLGCLWALPHPLLAPAVGLGALAALTRWLVASPPDYASAMISTPMGAAPVSLFGNAVRGFDIAGLVSIPALFAPDAVGASISMAVSAITLGVLVARR
ncbi:hypothetical protein J2S40_001462 [Nocardioides luteus]|uniref:ABC transporter permease n=1 Tax=Nocardioides luteus TaxID=1844 RepID=A0ABQ5T119_9ACTN|nr:DUF6297 family protein [Nocardioides luteus]MDR7310404.1 hypothetical protein [Nocardioides luteus]GGR52968.1 hypothetical protein GCM10010197_19000 [Nocardioides luteus]GLJ69816.1 hypothetical protein GCM10017579_38520 [Nocardioides luteus]